MLFSDLISIENLRVDCVVGVYPDERERPQALIADIEMRVNTERAGADERLEASVDYEAVAIQVSFILKCCAFHMLETAARALCSYLLLPPPPDQRGAPQVESVRVRLKKPGALPGTAVPSLQMERGVGWLDIRWQPRPFGAVETVIETGEAGVYRITLKPGAGIASHSHRDARESEMVLSDGLLCQGEPAGRGSVNHWPPRSPHGYHNPTDRYQSVLCVAYPRYDKGEQGAQ